MSTNLKSAISQSKVQSKTLKITKPIFDLMPKSNSKQPVFKTAHFI